MLQQLLQGQAKGSLEMNNKLVEIHSKLESLTSRVQIIESSSASSSSPQEYAQAVTLRSGRQFPSRGSPPQIAVDIDDEEGEDLVDYADNSTRTRSSWNKTLNQNSIELEETETLQDKPELDRAENETKQAPANQLNLLQRRKTLQQDHHHTNPLCPFQEGSRNNCWKHTRPSLMN
ncbi:unnamed protein product [Microthlaspi erraticum]|uniref:Uncharacterized protein n=1 Tax=Microthlaspi erraticum TaxID=1685480 RepID=A0A6D2IJH8_9BRAS|nr:unnamed protein product [Microthlaspi erraticum]